MRRVNKTLMGKKLKNGFVDTLSRFDDYRLMTFSIL